MDPQLSYRDAARDVTRAPLSEADAADVLGGTPYRRPPHYHGQRNYPGEYWAATTKTLLVYESRGELLRLQLADHDAEVAAIAAQPFCLSYLDDEGHKRKHVPDFMLRRRNGEVVIVNVKPPDWTRRARAPRRDDFKAIARTLSSRGWEHELWTGVDPVVAANVRFLAGYRRTWTIDDNLRDLPAQRWQPGDTIRTLERRLSSAENLPLSRAAVLHALWTQQLVVDLTTALSSGTVLSQRSPA